MSAFEAGVIAGMEKVAEKMSVIREAAKRVGHVVSRPGTMVEAMKAMTVPTAAHRRKSVSGAVDEIYQMQKKIMPKDAHKAIEEGLKPVYDSKKMRGKIMMSADAHKVVDPTAGKARAKNIRSIVNVHEQAERAATPASGSLHLSPSVLMKEKNLVNKLTGKGSHKARRSVESMRGPEYDHLREQLKSRFKDKRVEQFMEKGNKIPKAMRKAFLLKKQKMSASQAKKIMGKQEQTLVKKMQMAGQI